MERGHHTGQRVRDRRTPGPPIHAQPAVSPQIWYLLEGSYRMYKLFPSKGWEVYISLQVMHQSSLYTSSETMVTLFYEDRRLYQVPGGGHGETTGGRAVARSQQLPWPCLPTAAGVPYRQEAGPARQEACARGAAPDVRAARQSLPLEATRVRRFWTAAVVTEPSVLPTQSPCSRRGSKSSPETTSGL